ncbi:hypothetical protein U1Q18_012300 [Sarracenia purpurea var. burkii]
MVKLDGEGNSILIGEGGGYLGWRRWRKGNGTSHVVLGFGCFRLNMRKVAIGVGVASGKRFGGGILEVVGVGGGLYFMEEVPMANDPNGNWGCRVIGVTMLVGPRWLCDYVKVAQGQWHKSRGDWVWVFRLNMRKVAVGVGVVGGKRVGGGILEVVGIGGGLYFMEEVAMANDPNGNWGCHAIGVTMLVGPRWLCDYVMVVDQYWL